MTFDDLWISAIKKDCEEGKWLHAIQSAKIGLNWSKDELIKAVQVKDGNATFVDLDTITG